MARHPTQSTPQRPVHTVEQKRQDIQRLERRIAELDAFDPQLVTKRFSDPTQTALETAIAETLSAVFGHGTVEYNRYAEATQLDHGPVSMSVTPSWIAARGGGGYRGDDTHEARQHVTEGKAQALSLLRQAVRGLNEEIELDLPVAPPSPALRAKPSRKVFVVHGRDDATKNEVALFLSSIGLEPIILHMRPHGGRHILTKFQEESEGAGFAVILMTPDDEGALVGGTPQKRARQNVVFELGFFIGILGTPNVAALVKGHIEKPSDFDGIGYIDFDAKGEWKRLLAREMHHVGIPFDASKVFTA